MKKNFRDFCFKRIEVSPTNHQNKNLYAHTFWNTENILITYNFFLSAIETWAIPNYFYLFIYYFKILNQGHFFIALKERGMVGEGDRHHCERETSTGCLLIHTHNLSVCPDQESNLWPFGLQDNAPTNLVTCAKAIPNYFK